MRSILLLALAVLLTSAAFADDVVVQETVTANVSAGNPVSIGTINGDIQIESWDSDEIEVSYTITCETQEEMDAIEVVYSIQDGVDFTVEIDDEWHGGHNSKVDFFINVPRDVDLDYTIDNVNGAIVLHGGSGSAELSLVNGNVEADDFSGAMTVEVVNGDISIDEIPGLNAVSIVNGSVLLTVMDLLEDLSIESVNADMSLKLNGNARVDIETLSGSLDIDDSFNPEISNDIVGSSASFGQDGRRIMISTVSGNIEVLN